MEQHSTVSHNQEEKNTPEIQKSVLSVELDPVLQNLKKIAEKRYASYMGLAHKSDDKQPEFNSSSENFLKASELIVTAILRSKQAELERA